MTSLIQVARPGADVLPAVPASRTLRLGTPDRLPAPVAWPRSTTLLTGLSRVRGGTFSSTVGLVRFADGTTAHTDLIRLTPNVDAYSLDFGGTSPRQLSHYREVAWRHAPVHATALWWKREIAQILAGGYPRVSPGDLTRRLKEAGYPVGSGEVREHEAIAATQAAIWRLANGLELDTRPLDRPVRASARIGDHPSARPILLDARTPLTGIAGPGSAHHVGHTGTLDWHTQMPAGEVVYLELELAERPELESFSFVVGARTGRHDVRIHLDRSLDGHAWQPVSHSAFQLPSTRGRRVHKRLGSGSTLANASAASGQRGYRHYRLAASGPADRDGLLELLDVRLELAGGSRFRNDERIVQLYDLLLSQATSGPRVAAHARLLVGSRTPTGPSVFTPLVTLADGVPGHHDLHPHDQHLPSTDHRIDLRPEPGVLP